MKNTSQIDHTVAILTLALSVGHWINPAVRAQELTIGAGTTVTFGEKGANKTEHKVVNYNSTAKTQWQGREYVVLVAVVNLSTGNGFSMPYLEAKPGGEYIVSPKELGAVLNIDLVLEETKSPMVTNKVVAAKLNILDGKAAKATAGPEGMHISFSMMDGSMNWGPGALHDLKYLSRQIQFSKGEVECNGTKYSFADGAYVAVRDKQVVAWGVSRK